MSPIRVEVCRAAGLQKWVVACIYEDGKELLDLDLQHRTWQGLIPKACHAYPGVPVKVSADPFWTKRSPSR